MRDPSVQGSETDSTCRSLVCQLAYLPHFLMMDPLHKKALGFAQGMNLQIKG